MVLFMNYKTFSVATDDKGKKHKAQGGTRTMYATHNPAWDAKNRHDLPDEMPMDYAQIAHIFNAAPQAEQTQAPPVQQEQPVSNTNTFENTQQPTQQVMEVQPEPAPEQQTQQPEPAVQEPQVETNTVDPAIPQSLRDLMNTHGVSEQEIQVVVGKQGYFPMDTPILNYPTEFIEGVLVGAWEQVF